MKFKRLLTVGLMALFCAGTATAASQLNSVQVTPKANTATVSLRTTGSFAHKEYRPDEHLLLVDLTGVTTDPAVERTVALHSAVLKSYKLSSYTSASGSEVTRIEMTLGDNVTADVNRCERWSADSAERRRFRARRVFRPPQPPVRPFSCSTAGTRKPS